MTVTGSLNAPILKIAGTMNLTGGTETIGAISLTVPEGGISNLEEGDDEFLMIYSEMTIVSGEQGWRQDHDRRPWPSTRACPTVTRACAYSIERGSAFKCSRSTGAASASRPASRSAR